MLLVGYFGYENRQPLIKRRAITLLSPTSFISFSTRFHAPDSRVSIQIQELSWEYWLECLAFQPALVSYRVAV